jgi:hypothetical protein
LLSPHKKGREDETADGGNGEANPRSLILDKKGGDRRWYAGRAAHIDEPSRAETVHKLLDIGEHAFR